LIRAVQVHVVVNAHAEMTLLDAVLVILCRVSVYKALMLPHIGQVASSSIYFNLLFTFMIVYPLPPALSSCTTTFPHLYANIFIFNIATCLRVVL